MSKKLLAILTLACALALGGLVACSGGSGTSIGGNLGGGTFAVEGNKVTVSLPGNITTGYAWSYAIDGSNVELASEDYKTEATSAPVSGAGGTQTYEFNVTGAGDATITFTYARSWETTDSDQTCQLQLSAPNGTVTSANAVG